MPRAPKICSVIDCPNRQPCPTPGHAVKAWETSRRSERSLLSGSAQARRAERVMLQHGRVCHVCGLPMADEVDHVVPLAEGGADDESNLRPIHSVPCHREKTRAEAQRARQNM